MRVLKKKVIKRLNFVGNLLIIFSFLGLFLTFGPVLKEEVDYRINQTSDIIKQAIFKNNQPPNFQLEPPNRDFSIVIPKIKAVSPVFKDTDPFNEKEFSKVLRHGVAHAKGTALPGQVGNTYIFAHSTDAFYNVGRYNAVFYLIGKLQKGDEIYIYYEGEKYFYEVCEKKVVEAESVGYLRPLKEDVNTLTLQTCYPPGTTIKRLVVLADLVSSTKN